MGIKPVPVCTNVHKLIVSRIGIIGVLAVMAMRRVASPFDAPESHTIFTCPKTRLTVFNRADATDPTCCSSYLFSF